jgi:lipopolysaccharide exporter
MHRYFQKIQNGGGLFHRLLRGGAWLGAGSVAENALRFGRNMLLARLLAPESFGLMAIIISANSLMQVISAVGLKEAIIQNPRGAERSFLNAAWLISISRGILIYSSMFIAAPYLAIFYDSPLLSSLLRVAFLGTLAQSAMSVLAYTAVKRMEYKRWVALLQVGNCSGILITVVLAFLIKGVWALVIGFALEGVVRCALSFVIFPFRPRFELEKEATRAILRYARGIFGLPILMLVYTEASTFVVGKVLSHADLGIYALALAFARIPSMLTGSLADLFLPAFSQLQNDHGRVNRGLLKVTAVIASVSIPILAFALFFGEGLLEAAYGKRYVVAAAPFAILMANEILATCNVPIAAFFLSIGQPALLRKFSFFRAIIIVVLVYPLVRKFGITGAALTPFIAMAAAYVLQLRSLHSLTGLGIREYMAPYGKALILSWPVVAAWLACLTIDRQLSTASFAIVGMGIALGIYALCALVVIRSDELRRFFWPFWKPDRAC